MAASPLLLPRKIVCPSAVVVMVALPAVLVLLKLRMAALPMFAVPAVAVLLKTRLPPSSEMFALPAVLALLNWIWAVPLLVMVALPAVASLNRS